MNIFAVIALSAGVFSSFILILVYILILAEKKLVAQGKIKILINEDENKSLEINAGGNLLLRHEAERRGEDGCVPAHARSGRANGTSDSENVRPR